ncbi:DNA-binding protein [Actinocorallia sp. B10E7]|uniref:DNA-binding protein n=1 Tax=Actinocorallia sp. B10E7 TaxID=3153558 RepID=UPI00325EB514
MDDVRELLAAGAVLSPGTEGAGEEAVPLTARTYRHPALDGRAVVRLSPAELGDAEDLAAVFLGLEPAAEPEVVGVGRRASLGFPEWVLAHHPEDGHHALDVVPELERIVQRAKVKPKAALDAFQALAGRLSSSVPHFLPTFYEQAGREFIAVGHRAYAARMFGYARKAETEHALPIDEERLDAVLLEFELAGVLPVKSLPGYAKGLSARVPADEALRRFTRLCVRRTAGGAAPSAQAAADLRRLAEAADENAEEVEIAYLAEILALPGAERAAGDWWTAHRSALAVLTERRPDLRGVLLNLLPTSEEADFPALWLDILEECGATAALCDPGNAPEEARPADGGLGWLRRFLGLWYRNWHPAPPPGLYPLIERMADRLRAELTAPGQGLEPPSHPDLLDLLLALGVPVADPGPQDEPDLEHWAAHEDRRDLTALAADRRFLPGFRRRADRLNDGSDGRNVLRALAAVPGGRTMLAEWVGGIARRSAVEGLPGLHDVLSRLGRLPDEVLAQAEGAVREVAATDVAALLARTLRAGLFDELGWPAWEEAVAELADCHGSDGLTVADAWPHLIVADHSHARVIGAEGTVLTHDLRVSLGGDQKRGFHYVDGELLFCWKPWWQTGPIVGYWHTDPDRHLPLEGAFSGRVMYEPQDPWPVSLPLEGGGRTTGAGTLRGGDAVLPGIRRAATDGTSYWTVWKDGEDAEDWYEYDPVSGERGDKDKPGFFADAARGLPDGSAFVTGWLLPLPSKEDTPVGAPVDGSLGWRIVRLPDGSLRGEDLAGNTVTTPEGMVPFSALFLPGDERPRAVVCDPRELALVDPDGVVTSLVRTDGEPGPFAEGSVIMPPVRYWHCLRPRDPRGSAALRGIGHETASALLETAGAGGDLPEAVRALLPDVAHEALVAAVAGVARHAAEQQKALNALTAGLERYAPARREAPDAAAEQPEEMEKAVIPEPVREETPADPSDRLVKEALNGLGYASYVSFADETPRLLPELRIMVRAAAGAVTVTAPEGRPVLHIDGPDLREFGLETEPLPEIRAAMAYRAVSELTAPEHRETLRALLRLLDDLDLTPDGMSRWRLFDLHLDEPVMRSVAETGWPRSWNHLLPLDGGAFMNFRFTSVGSHSGDFRALFHDPSGRFDVPAPYTVVSSQPLVPPANTVPPDGFLAEAAGRGPVPWSSEAAAEFARLTGVTGATARLVVAGLPWVDKPERNFLPPETRAALGLKAVDAAVARDELSALTPRIRRALVGALLPADPARLWTDGPDAAAAAEVWNTEVGRRVPVPEELMNEAHQVLQTGGETARRVSAVLDPASEPRLSRDVKWIARNRRVAPEDENVVGFTVDTLPAAVTTAAWLAHRLPAGDPLRERLPASLEAVHARLANPDLMLGFDDYVELAEFRRTAGPPTAVGDGYEQYGALVMATATGYPYPGIRPALLDEPGNDTYLAALRIRLPELTAFRPAMRTARDERFAALLADPGDPVAGERDADGTWWPQDPSRSVPDLVAEASDRYGLGPDAAAVYLMLLAMPDPTDQNTARWTGWKPARLKTARAELAATDLVVEAGRARAGRSLFLPCGWADLRKPILPVEEWKLPLYVLSGDEKKPVPLGVLVPTEPVADLYRRAWRRIAENDVPRLADLEIRRRPRGGR